MKTKAVFLLFVVSFFLTQGCGWFSHDKKVVTQNILYMAAEVEGSDQNCGSAYLEDGLYGALYLTTKGNAIFNMSNDQADTMHYYYGKYRLEKSGIEITLDHEFYYAGKWDATWDGDQADFRKGSTRVIATKKLSLTAYACDSSNYHAVYGHNQKLPGSDVRAGAIVLFPYVESKTMKFYSWFYRQVPALSRL